MDISHGAVRHVAVHVIGVRVLHILSRAEHEEIAEWLLCSVGSQSGHQKQEPVCQLPLNNSAWIFLGTGRQLLPRPRQTLWFFLLSSPCLVSFSFAGRGGGRVNAVLLLQSPPGFPAFPRVVALPPPPFLTLEPSQLQPHDPPLSRWFLSFSLCICSCYSGALCALCFHQKPDENQSPTSCPGPQASAPPRALAMGHS